MSTQTSRRLPTSQSLLGAIIILIGLVFLLDTTGIMETGILVRYIPSLFVLVGIWALVQSGFQNLAGPVVLILVAGAAQLVTIGVTTVDQLVAYWPVLIIAFGAALLASQYRARTPVSDASFTSGFTIFGGIEKRNQSPRFGGAELTAIFGGTELDLRDASVEDPPARIHVMAMFGGIEIAVPEEWNVQVDVLPIFGDAKDGRRRSPREHEHIDLVITGFVAFGDVSVTQ